MGYDTEIIRFLETAYIPQHQQIPGYLNIGCLVREFGTRERERNYTFQYDSINGKLFFLVYPTQVRLPIGDVNNVEEATEHAKLFLLKWLGDDTQVRLQIAQEIHQLEEIKRSAR